MCRKNQQKCQHCKQWFQPDYRNRNRQKFCSKPDCRKVSKATSQKRWCGKPENRDDFKGADHVHRVQEWRRAHPEYWRKKDALQDPCDDQNTEIKEENREKWALDLNPSSQVVV